MKIAPPTSAFTQLARWGLLLTCGQALADGAALLAADPQVAQRFESQVRPLLVEFCVQCHNGEKKKGDLDLASLATGEKAVEHDKLWTTVAMRLADFEMPPDDSPQPPPEKRNVMLAWIRSLGPQGDCRQLAGDETQYFYRGYVMSRRLTRAEYNNTIRDLVGLDLKPADAFPADGSGGEGFDTAGNALFTSPILLEKYLSAAANMLAVALPDKPVEDGADTDGRAAIRAARAQILFVEASDAVPAREAARQIVARFAERAFRRPVKAAEVERFLTLFDLAAARGDGFVAAVRLSLESVLISPHFLFLVETEPAESGVYRLGAYPLASRLSYFLWSTLPDAELLKLAAEGRLSDEQVLRAQVRRMLADPRARALAENFALPWLGLDAQARNVQNDAQKFPEYDAELAAAMRDEAIALCDAVLREDRSLLEFLDADYAFVNERLARHYGIADVQGTQLRSVKLGDRRRGGLLGLGAMLTATSYPLRTSPVLRGRWVSQHVLGAKIPPPPPNAGSLPRDEAAAEPNTLRGRLEAHRANAECASCHKRMDPLGFALENFDVLGRWRNADRGQPIDASGKLASGEEFRGPAELKAVLIEHRGEFLHNLAWSMLGYALGRELNGFDDCVVDRALKNLEAGGHRNAILVEQIVLSYPFLYRYAKK